MQKIEYKEPNYLIWELLTSVNELIEHHNKINVDVGKLQEDVDYLLNTAKLD